MRIAYHWLAGDVAEDLDTLADTVASFELLGIVGVRSSEVVSTRVREEIY